MILSAYLRIMLKLSAIFQHLNRQHPNISLICESENSRPLPLFYVLVAHSNNGFFTNLYRSKALPLLNTNFKGLSPI